MLDATVKFYIRFRRDGRDVMHLVVAQISRDARIVNPGGAKRGEPPTWLLIREIWILIAASGEHHSFSLWMN